LLPCFGKVDRADEEPEHIENMEKVLEKFDRNEHLRGMIPS
jgi:hypothetical protein